jgi:hypothetical protein
VAAPGGCCGTTQTAAPCGACAAPEKKLAARDELAPNVQAGEVLPSVREEAAGRACSAAAAWLARRGGEACSRLEARESHVVDSAL